MCPLALPYRSPLPVFCMHGKRAKYPKISENCSALHLLSSPEILFDDTGKRNEKKRKTRRVSCTSQPDHLTPEMFANALATLPLSQSPAEECGRRNTPFFPSPRTLSSMFRGYSQYCFPEDCRISPLKIIS